MCGLIEKEGSTYHTCPSVSVSNGEELVYQEGMENYTTQSKDVSTTASSPYQLEKNYEGFEASWNPLEHRVPRYDPGSIAFAPPSPSDSLLYGLSKSPGNAKPKTSHKKKSPTKSTARSPKGKSKASQRMRGFN